MLPDDVRKEIEASRNPAEFALGHPTTPGLRDPYELRVGRASPGNGSPGLPKIWPGRPGTHGAPSTHGGPFQAGTVYDTVLGDDGSS